MESRKLKILHLLYSNKFSGAENVVCQIIKNSNDKMLYVSPNGEIEKTLAEKNIKFEPLEKFNKKNLLKIVKDFQPDVIHAHDFRAIALASKINHIKKVCTIHKNDPAVRKLSIKSLILNLVLKKFDKIIFVSENAFNDFYFKNKIQNKTIILKNAINSRELKNKIEQDKNDYNFDCVFLGRLAYPKNPQRFIDIASKVNEKTSFALVGDGPFKEECETLIKEKKLQNKVKLLGFMKNPYKVLSQAKLLVITSEFEGLPMVALEAFALGVPIIATKTGDLPNIIIDGKTGYTFETDEQAVNFINNLTQNKNILDKMRSECTDYFNDNVSIKKYINTLSQIYK